MTTYHLSLALAHWTSRPELQGKREYLYRNVAWLLALAHCLNAGPFGDKHRGHVAHERIVDFMPAIDPKRSSEIAAFWRKLGAVKTHGHDTRGTDYEIVLPSVDEMRPDLAARVEEASRGDYLVRRYEAPVAVQASDKPKRKSDKPERENFGEAEQRRARVLEVLLPDVEAHTRRGTFCELLNEAAHTKLRYKTNPKTGASAAEVEAAIDFVEANGWDFVTYSQLCRWVAADPSAPSNKRWLFTPQCDEYRARAIAAMQTQPAEAPKQVEPASDATRELTEKVASLLRVSVESVIDDVTRALARGNRPAEIVDEATSYSSGGAKPKWLRAQGGN